MEYEVMGYATIKAQVWSLADLRELIAQADSWQLRDECKIDWDYGCVFIDVADTSRGDQMEPISCGDHYPVRDANGEYVDHIDFVINAHKCARHEPAVDPEPYQGPETYEEALEEALDPEPPSGAYAWQADKYRQDVAAYDWPTRDRMRRAARDLTRLGQDLV